MSKVSINITDRFTMVYKENKLDELINKLVAIFYNGSRIGAEYKEAVSFILSVSISIFVISLYSLVYMFHYKLYFLASIYIATSIFLVSLIFLSKFTKRYSLLFGISLSMSNIPIGFCCYYIGGALSPVAFWFCTTILAAKMFGNNKSVIMTSMTALIALIANATLELNDIVYTGKLFTKEEYIYYTIAQVITIVMTVLAITGVYRKILDNSINEIEVKNDHIKHFIRLLCHDIANPLTIVVARSKIGKSRYLDEDAQKKSFTTIHRAGELVSQILDEVRTYEAITDGKITVNLAPVSLKSVLENIDFVFKDRLIEKRINFQQIGLNDQDILVLSDENSLKNQVFSNFISNAIKFSHRGSSIQFTVQGKGSWVDIIIRDHGIGIPKNLLPHILEIGEETSRLGTDGERGTGFGLPLAKTYIDSYGGRLSIESFEEKDNPIDHGTSFKISLKKAS